MDLDVYLGWEDLFKKVVFFGKVSVGFMNIFIGEFKFDVVYVYDWYIVFVLGFLKKYFGVRVVFIVYRFNRVKVFVSYFYEVNFGELVLFFDFDFEYIVGYIVDVVIIVSRSYLWEEWSFFKNFDGKVIYVFNGIDCFYWNEEFFEGKDLLREERRKRIF